MWYCGYHNLHHHDHHGGKGHLGFFGFFSVSKEHNSVSLKNVVNSWTDTMEENKIYYATGHTL